MKKFFKITGILVLFIMISGIGFVACENDSSDPEIIEIKVGLNPTKVDYKVGEYFNPRGLAIIVKWSEGKADSIIKYEDEAGEFSFVPPITAPLYITDKSVIVIYKKKNVQIPITVTKTGSGSESDGNDTSGGNGTENGNTNSNGGSKPNDGTGTDVNKPDGGTDESSYNGRGKPNGGAAGNPSNDGNETEYGNANSNGGNKPNNESGTDGNKPIGGNDNENVTDGGNSDNGSDKNNPVITGIEVQSSPTKIEYNVGDYFDPRGLVISVKWSEGKSNTTVNYKDEVGEFSFLPTLNTPIKATDESVIVVYKNYPTTIPINVQVVTEPKMVTEWDMAGKTSLYGIAEGLSDGQKLTEGDVVIRATSTNGNIATLTALKGSTFRDDEYGRGLKATSSSWTTLPSEPTHEKVGSSKVISPKACLKLALTTEAKVKIEGGLIFNSSGLNQQYNKRILFENEKSILGILCGLADSKYKIEKEYKCAAGTYYIGIEGGYISKITVENIKASEVDIYSDREYETEVDEGPLYAPDSSYDPGTGGDTPDTPSPTDPEPSSEIKYIKVGVQPTKREYEVGECFDPTGLILHIGYINGKSEKIYYEKEAESLTFSPSITTPLGLTDTEVIVLYKGYEIYPVYIPITVTSNEPNQGEPPDTGTD